MSDVKNGCLHLYIGDGKGKSTAAAGLALRMLGRGRTVLMAPFLKGNPSGEHLALEKFGDHAIFFRPSMRHKAFLWDQTESQRMETLDDLKAAWNTIRKKLKKTEIDLFVFDELLDVLEMGAIGETDILEALGSRHAAAEVVLTGRRTPDTILEISDYVTEMRLVRHPFNKGIKARRGIEY